jgi:hypothetical protein
MEKIYGYKEKDVFALANFIKEKGELPLSTLFERFGAINGKAKGTVRNLYYALAKKSNADKEFCQKYSTVFDMLGGEKSMNHYLPSHSVSYFKSNGSHGCEFFANHFASLALNQQETISATRHYLPKSAKACEELVEFLMKTR